MEISLLKAVLNNISSFFHLPSYDNIKVEAILKYYQKAEVIMRLLKTVLDVIVDSEIASNEALKKPFEELGQSVNDLREQFVNWKPLSSKVYFVFHIESLISKIQTLGLDIFLELKSSNQGLPDELGSVSLEHCIQKVKYAGYEQMTSVIKEATRDQEEGVVPSSETLVNIAESLSLRSNQEILIEAAALEKLKENAEQSEKTEEAEFIDQIIALMTRMHERLITIKRSESCTPIPIPPDFCCPLSIELMTDPVILSSGQTYEQAFIKNWIDLGLTVCPKTRKTLSRTNLIPNYTVKALIANWCESNNVKLPDPAKSLSLNQPSHLLTHAGSDLHKDVPVLSHSNGSQPELPESTGSIGSPTKNSVPTGRLNCERGSPLHPRSKSGGSLGSITGNGQSLDITRISLTSSKDQFANSEERSADSVGQPSFSPSRKEFSNANGADVSQNHNRSALASTILSNANLSLGVQAYSSEALQTSNTLTGYSSDASAEAKAEPQAAIQLQGRPRRQTIWHKPSERFTPRLISSPAAETRADLSGIEAQVRNLIEDLQSTSIDIQREATAELRLLAKQNTDNRIVIASCGAINLLVGLLRSTDSKVMEDAVTSLLNLSINDNNKIAIADANAIEPLIHVLQTGSSEAKENSAATLFSLSVREENKIRIGRSGAISPLVDLLSNGTPRGKRDAATALFNLSIYPENKGRIVQAGAVKHLVELMDPAAGMVDKAVAVLANLATIPEGRTAIGKEGGIPVLVEVIELGSTRGKENAAAALLQLCTTNGRFCNLVLQEGAVPPLVVLSQSGTARAREKAQTLLTYFRNHRHGNAGRG